MTEIVARALAHWDMRGAEFRLIAKRENQVFRVDHAGQSYAMRLHRPNYRSDCELSSELTWMRAVARAGISVPEPIVSASGDYLHHVGDYQVDVLTWLNGHPLGSAGNRLEIKNSNRLFYRLGAQLAQLHVECDEWYPPDNFVRPSW